jgi:hypothetical protein
VDDSVHGELPCKYQLGQHVHVHGNRLDDAIVVACVFVKDRVMYRVCFPNPKLQRPGTYEVDQKNLEARDGG